MNAEAHVQKAAIRIVLVVVLEQPKDLQVNVESVAQLVKEHVAIHVKTQHPQLLLVLILSLLLPKSNQSLRIRLFIQSQIHLLQQIHQDINHKVDREIIRVLDGFQMKMELVIGYITMDMVI